MSTLSEYDKEWCRKIHTELCRKPVTSPFREPVDPVRDHATNYFDIVTNPMDLTTMRKKLTDGRYKTVKEFVDDFHLICDNAVKFNGQNSMYAYIAYDLKNWIDEQYENKATSAEDEWRRKLVNVVDRMQAHVRAAPEAHAAAAATAVAACVSAIPHPEDANTAQPK